MTNRAGLVIISLAACCALCFSLFSPDPAEAGGAGAVVTAMQGSARLVSGPADKGTAVKKGTAVRKDQEIVVAERSRVELRLPDGSFMRLAEKTRLKMQDLSFDAATDAKNVKVGLSIGRLWAKVKKLTTRESSVEVVTVNAVAGVRGTVYRLNVEQDASAVVKVYDGSVYVANPPRDAAAAAGKSLAPHQVAGPHEVPPPYHEVSREEWTSIVMAMQQISISAQGVPSKPQNFDPRADQDDWVKWNQERDRTVSF